MGVKAMTEERIDKGETKRDRVRRLLIGPMEELGWRKPGNVTAEAHRAALDRLCDELGYLADADFATLRQVLRGKGDGKGRDAWPPVARIIAYAEMVRPRPLEELPAVLRWFRSAAGEAAEAGGRLVEEHDYWLRHKHPPVSDGARRQVAQEADRNAHRAEVITDQIARGVAPAPGEREWLHAYQERKARVRRLMDRQPPAGEAA